MKKFFVAVCCAMIASSSLFAQDENVASPPTADAVEAAVAPEEDTAPAVVDATPAVEVQATEVPTGVAPVAPVADVGVIETGVIENEVIVGEGTFQGSVMEGTIMPSTVGTPVYGNGFSNAIVNPGCSGCGGNVVAPAFQAAPSMGSFGSVMSAPVYGAAVAAPVSSFVAAPVAANTGCVDCKPRRKVVRTVVTRGRSVFTRVRGRRNSCCN